ncbi:glycoside hydrolase family 76 protein [Streptomyces sp. NBC_00829]|uniref:glycoside hydrolase family 76 protein n=1 Tax=Streptomyces sp. NBC_00829 TaxID=2903679 RepID=UPI00386351C1|nr:glycoside hydrolase family 76 protein [Streptomyces sp. NBC_00829]
MVGALLACVLVEPASAATPDTSTRATASVNARRAVASYTALQDYLALPDGSELYRQRYPIREGDRAHSYEWPFSQAHVATLDLTGLPGRKGTRFLPDLASRATGQERYWNAAGGRTGLPGYVSQPVFPYGAGGDLFYDDNEWVGLLNIQKYLMFSDKAALTRAKDIFALVMSGWDTDATHAAPGGVFWTQADWTADRNTVSNMPAAQLGLRLYQITKDRSYLDWSLRMYNWTNQHLLSPDGLYWDHLNPTGSVDKNYWSYNQGVPVGVNVLLYQITHDRSYLDRAKRIADAAYNYYVKQGRLSTQPPEFNAVFFKNLLLLESVTKKQTYRDAMNQYASDVWEENRNPYTGLFEFGDSSGTEAVQQAAMIQIYAVLGWNHGEHKVLY